MVPWGPMVRWGLLSPLHSLPLWRPPKAEVPLRGPSVTFFGGGHPPMVHSDLQMFLLVILHWILNV